MSSKGHRSEYDVIVIGGGPAGAVTAYELCRKEPGLRVLLFEKCNMPRLKPCAGGISPQAEKSLIDLGLWDRIRDKGYPVTCAEIITATGRSIELSGGSTATVFHRSVLDSLLLSEAEKAGTEVRQNVKVERFIYDGQSGNGMIGNDPPRHNLRVIGVSTGREEYYASLIVIAAGAATSLRLPDPDKEHITSCTAWFEQARFPSNKMQMIFPKELSPHYAWLFPESDTRCNIGLCVRLPKLKELRLQRGITELYNDVLRRYFHEVISDARQLIPPKVFPMFPSKRIGRGAYPGTILTGDAAGGINPLTGEGISFAIESGIIAAEMILQGRRLSWDWTALDREYISRLDKSLRPALRKARRVRFFAPMLMRAAGFLSALPGIKPFLTKLMAKV